MRCPKCGYTSFDHLASCKKCDKDLSESREMLNLLDFEPQVPFLLGSLVGEMQGGGSGYQHKLSLTQETELELGGLDVPETEDLEETVEMSSMRETMDVKSSEDLNLSEIGLDTLEGMEETEVVDKDTAEIEMSDPEKPRAEGGTPEEEDEEFLGLEFEMEETLGVDFDPFGEDADSESAESLGEDNLELDLDDHDLSQLAKELEDQLEAEAGGKKKVTTGDISVEQTEMTVELEEK
jgi:hypothetical protein